MSAPMCSRWASCSTRWRAGQRPFSGDTNVSILSAILKDTPKSLTELRADLPRELAKIVRRCLQKGPEQRYQTAKDLRNELESLKEELASGELETSTPAVRVPISAGRRAGLLAAGLIVLALGAAATWRVTGLKPDHPSRRLAFSTVKIKKLTTSGNVIRAAISSDGRVVAYVRREAGLSGLWIRQVASSSEVQVLSAAGVIFEHLAFSPDGDFIYFTRSPFGKGIYSLYRIPSLGGAERKILDDVARGFAVAPDGRRLLFARTNLPAQDATVRIAAADGSGEQVLMNLKRPEFLTTGQAWSPDGNRIALVATASSPETGTVNRVIVRDIATGDERSLPGLPQTASVDWLSDGTGLLITGSEAWGQARQLWVLPYPSGPRRRLTRDFSSYHGLSAVRTRPALISVAGNFRSDVWLFDSASKQSRQITTSTGAGW